MTWRTYSIYARDQYIWAIAKAIALRSAQYAIHKMTQPFTVGFQSLNEEHTLPDLPVRGSLPAWLSGTLIRNGPAKFEFGGESFRHWFDGAAMLHRFTITAGRVSYGNRFLRTPGYQANSTANKLSYNEFATDPCRSIFGRVMSLFGKPRLSHNANVNLTQLAGQFLAMTETPLPVSFDPDTLATVGVQPFADKLGFVGSTAHPHFDPQRNVGINHLIQYGGRRSQYHFAFIPNEPPLRRRIISRVDVAEPAYLHSFGMSENYLILAEYPYTVNPLRFLLVGKPFIENFEWRPERGTRFIVIDKDSGEVVREHQAEACFAFHHINAFEDGDDLFVDLSAYEDPTIIDALYLDRLRTQPGEAIPQAQFRRYHLPSGANRATYSRLTKHTIELPRLNYRHNGQPYRYAYGTTIAAEQPHDFLNALLKVDLRERRERVWYEAGCYPGEPIFVAAPDAQAEDAGVILSVVVNSETAESFLLVLAADDFCELARATVPHTVPFGFHGQFFR